MNIVSSRPTVLGDQVCGFSYVLHELVHLSSADDGVVYATRLASEMLNAAAALQPDAEADRRPGLVFKRVAPEVAASHGGIGDPPRPARDPAPNPRPPVPPETAAPGGFESASRLFIRSNEDVVRIDHGDQEIASGRTQDAGASRVGAAEYRSRIDQAANRSDSRLARCA